MTVSCSRYLRYLWLFFPPRDLRAVLRNKSCSRWNFLPWHWIFIKTLILNISFPIGVYFSKSIHMILFPEAICFYFFTISKFDLVWQRDRTAKSPGSSQNEDVKNLDTDILYCLICFISFLPSCLPLLSLLA